MLYADDSVSIKKTHKNHWKRFGGHFVVSQQLADIQQVVSPPRWNRIYYIWNQTYAVNAFQISYFLWK